MRRQPKIVAVVYNDQPFNLYDRIVHRTNKWTGTITALHANHDHEGNVVRYHCHVSTDDGRSVRAYMHQVRWQSH